MIQLSDCNLSVGLLNLASAAKSIILLPCTAGDAYSQRDFDFAAPNRRCLLGLLLKILDALGPSLARCAIKGGRDRRAGLEDSGGPYGQGRRSSFGAPSLSRRRSRFAGRRGGLAADQDPKGANIDGRGIDVTPYERVSRDRIAERSAW